MFLQSEMEVVGMYHLRKFTEGLGLGLGLGNSTE